MLRRTWLRVLAGVIAFGPATARRVSARTAGDQTAVVDWPASQLAMLRALAEVGLPTSLDAAARGRVVTAFVTWHRGYREGADRGHGYGSGRLAPVTGPAPARQYPPQFAALDREAANAGAASFAAAPLDIRRGLVERALNDPQRVQNLPASPTGANLVADFLGFYFNSPEAWDQAYRAAIRRDSCRSLDGSDRRPAPLAGGRGPL